MIRHLKAALCAASFLCATQAHAATIVQSGGSQFGESPQFSRFNPALGTLNSVAIEASYSALFFFRNFGSSAPLVEASGMFGGAQTGYAYFSGTYQSSRYSADSISIGVSAFLSSVESENLSRFIGNGTLSFENGAQVEALADGGQLVRINPPSGGLSSLRFNVTYDYTVAAVPEPSTWALMLAGFGMVGYSLRRRHRAGVLAT